MKKELPEFPKYANHYGYSDIEPWEVVRVISDKTLEIRVMKTEFDESARGDLKFHIGGFAAHCSNMDAQKWIITSAGEGAYTMRIRKTKSGEWRNGSLKFRLSDEPVKFYDYNF